MPSPSGRSDLDPTQVPGAVSREFLASVSHELRTPMSAILGFTQLLRLEPLSPSQADSVGEIEKAGQQLLSLINELLDLNKLESGHAVLQIAPVDLQAAVDACLRQLAPLADARRVAMRSQVPRLGVLADPQRLHQVLQNLLSNAIKYNRPGGHVVLCAAEWPGGRVRLSVQDTGLGIPPQHQAAVFEPFQRGAAEGGEVGGTGIGLTLARRIARQMAGDMGLRSTEGVGSEFWVELPRATLPEQAAAPAAPGPVVAPDPARLMALTYDSHAVQPLTADELAALVARAKAFNREVGVTGLLLYHDGNFFQYLEGPAQGLERVMERVRRSSLHRHLYVHVQGETDRRYFDDWDMGLADISGMQGDRLEGLRQALAARWGADGAQQPGLRLLLNFAEHMTRRPDPAGA